MHCTPQDVRPHAGYWTVGSAGLVGKGLEKVAFEVLSPVRYPSHETSETGKKVGVNLQMSVSTGPASKPIMGPMACIFLRNSDIRTLLIQGSSTDYPKSSAQAYISVIILDNQLIDAVWTARTSYTGDPV